MTRIRQRVVPLALLLILTFAGVRTAHAATRDYDRGDRLTVLQLHATDGTERFNSFESPSIIILWSTWCPESLIALNEILSGAPKGGVRWQLIPINVDAPSLNSSDTSRVNSAARVAGWHGPVWHDRGYSLMDEWGVIALPTIALTALGGAIDEIEHDWSPLLRDRLFVIYFGAATDSFPGMLTESATPRCKSKAESARKLWRMGKGPSAIAVMQAVADSCVGLHNDFARLADWKWSLGDSLRDRLTIESLVVGGDRSAWTLTAKASLAMRRREDTAAISLCRAAIALDSAYFPAWILLAERSLQSGDSLTAFTAYTRARELNRWDARALMLGARFAEAQGKLEESARLMRAAVETRLRRASF